MSDSALHFTKRELQRIFFAPRFWAVLMGAALLIGITGPFGTFESLPLLPRIAYWIAIAVLTMFAGFATVLFFVRWMFPQSEPHWAAALAGGALAGLPIAAIVWLINAGVFSEPGGPIGFGRLAVYCVAIAATVSLLIFMVRPDAWKEEQAVTPGATAEAPHELHAAAEPPALLNRLPPRLRGRLTRLAMQDHYVEVHTEKGSALILMRLADAVRETGGTAGLRIHRSHWVALEAVEKVIRKDGRLFVRMTDGALLPVSRSHAAAVREAGLA